MKKENSEKERKKKSYIKPELRRVGLRPGEAVLGGCKTTTDAGPGQATCATVPACSYTES
jgi:hypothetical protein